MFLTENQIFFLSDHMMDTSQLASPIIPVPGKASTRGAALLVHQNFRALLP